MKTATTLILTALALGASWAGVAHAQTAPDQTGAIVGNGRADAVDVKAGSITISHDPIAALQWPAMAMSFPVLPGTDLGGIKVGDRIAFALTRYGIYYAVEAVQPQE